MNPWLIGVGVVGALLYFMKSAKPASALNSVGGSPLVGTGNTPGATSSQTIAHGIGNELTALTGNPLFGLIGGKLASMFGGDFKSGSREADELVQQYQNPLGDYLGQIIAAWNTDVASGIADNMEREKVKTMLRAAAADFYAIAQSYPNKGAGGISTIKHVVEDILIPDIDRLQL